MKLLKKLINIMDTESVVTKTSSSARVKFSNSSEDTTSVEPLKVSTDSKISKSIPVVLASPSGENMNLLRHFAISNGFKKIAYLNYNLASGTVSLAASLFQVEELFFSEIKSLSGMIEEDSIMIVISSESSSWLEQIMFLRRNIPTIKVFLSAIQGAFLAEEKIISKYRENFSGVIIKKVKGYEREYSLNLLQKKLQRIPLVFLSDGVISLGNEAIKEKWAA